MQVVGTAGTACRSWARRQRGEASCRAQRHPRTLPPAQPDRRRSWAQRAQGAAGTCRSRGTAAAGGKHHTQRPQCTRPPARPDRHSSAMMRAQLAGHRHGSGGSVAAGCGNSVQVAGTAGRVHGAQAASTAAGGTSGERGGRSAQSSQCTAWRGGWRSTARTPQQAGAAQQQ